MSLIYESKRSEEQGASIIEEVDFELELIHKDEILNMLCKEILYKHYIYN